MDKAKARRLKNLYGLSPAAWLLMLKKQNGVCWICQKLPKSGRLCVDHIHIKGYKKLPEKQKKKYVRGLLCFGCNTVFARFERRTNPRWLFERVQEYFKVFNMKGE